MINVGIECESIEADSWGVGRIVNKLLENIAARPELSSEFRFFLYFKSRIPDLPFLNNPVFIKKIIGTNSFGLYYYLLLPAKLWFQRPDFMFFPNYMLPIIFRGKSLVMLTEDIYYEINSGNLPWRYKLAYKIFAGWWTVRHATKIMAISETSKQELTKLFGIAPSRITVNQLGVDNPRQISNEIQNSNFQIPDSYILYVGQAFPRRHLRETMFAFEKLISPNFNHKLIAVGKDKYNPPILKKLAEDINRRIGREGVLYKEYVPESELAELYSNAKLLVYVSSKEAFGLPPLEALSYGVPPVVAESELNHEIYEDQAFLVRQPITPESIVAAIQEALANDTKRQKIKESAERILKKYTWQKHTDRFLEVLKAMI